MWISFIIIGSLYKYMDNENTSFDIATPIRWTNCRSVRPMTNQKSARQNSTRSYREACTIIIAIALRVLYLLPVFIGQRAFRRDSSETYRRWRHQPDRVDETETRPRRVEWTWWSNCVYRWSTGVDHCPEERLPIPCQGVLTGEISIQVSQLCPWNVRQEF